LHYKGLIAYLTEQVRDAQGEATSRRRVVATADGAAQQPLVGLSRDSSAEHLTCRSDCDAMRPGKDGADELWVEDAEFDAAVAETGVSDALPSVRLGDARDADDNPNVAVLGVVLNRPVLTVQIILQP